MTPLPDSNTPKTVEECRNLIRGLEALPSLQDEERAHLADAYFVMGGLLYKTRTPDALKEAVASYDQALDHFLKLPLDVDEYRNALASAYNNRGNALSDLRTPDALKEAVASYDLAVEYRLELPLDVDRYRNDLANAYFNRGNALSELRTPDALRQSVADYDEAVRLLKDMDQHILKVVEVSARAHIYKASACLEIDTMEYLDMATDAADEGLNLLRDLEVAGIYVLRPLREDLFPMALNTYLAISPRFVPELILDHLDPDNPGAAPESIEMHHAALQGLREAYDLARQREEADDLHGEIFLTQRRLFHIRQHYFMGTATGAFLNARYQELRGAMPQAEDILTGFTERNPTNPKGYQHLAAFYHRLGNGDKTVENLEKAIHTLAGNLPAAIDGGILQDIGEKIVALADLAADQVFGSWPVKITKEARNHVNRQVSRVVGWLTRLGDKLSQPFSDWTRSPFEQIQAHIQAKQEEWNDQREARLMDAWQAQERALSDEKMQAMLRSLGQFARKVWGQWAAGLLATFQEAWEYYDRAWQEADSDRRAEIEEEIAEILCRRLRQLNLELYDQEVEADLRLVQEELATEWEVLSDGERKHLAIGLGVMRKKNSHLYRFAGQSVGLAVETSLSEFLFNSIRNERRNQKAGDIPVSDPSHYREPVVADFFNCNGKHLMLGNMVGTFNRAVNHKDPPSRPVDQLVASYLGSLPRARILLDSGDSARRIRGKALNRINNIRVQCSHPYESPGEETLEWLWEHVVSDPEHAFFRYFRGAFLSGPLGEAASGSLRSTPVLESVT